MVPVPESKVGNVLDGVESFGRCMPGPVVPPGLCVHESSRNVLDSFVEGPLLVVGAEGPFPLPLPLPRPLPVPLGLPSRNVKSFLLLVLQSIDGSTFRVEDEKPGQLDKPMATVSERSWLTFRRFRNRHIRVGNKSPTTMSKASQPELKKVRTASISLDSSH